MHHKFAQRWSFKAPATSMIRQSFLEPSQVNVICVRCLPSPSHEPLGPSVRDAQVSGSMEKFEPNPDDSSDGVDEDI